MKYYKWRYFDRQFLQNVCISSESFMSEFTHARRIYNHSHTAESMNCTKVSYFYQYHFSSSHTLHLILLLQLGNCCNGSHMTIFSLTDMSNLSYQKLLMKYVDNLELVYFFHIKPIILEFWT